MIDLTFIRVHQRAATGKKRGSRRCMGRSRRGLMSKIHALVDAEGRPVTPRLTGGQIADWANIPPKATRKGSFSFSRWVYSKRNLVERFFNKIKQFRGIATRYDKRPENYLAAVKLVAVRIWCQGLGVDGLDVSFQEVVHSERI